MIIFRDVNQLQGLLESAAKAHHAAEKRLPKHPWERWYAAYLAHRAQNPAFHPDDSVFFADVYVQGPSDPHSGSAF